MTKAGEIGVDSAFTHATIADALAAFLNTD